MSLQYRAAVLHAAQTPLSIETVTAAALRPTDPNASDPIRRGYAHHACATSKRSIAPGAAQDRVCPAVPA